MQLSTCQYELMDASFLDLLPLGWKVNLSDIYVSFWATQIFLFPLKSGNNPNSGR